MKKYLEERWMKALTRSVLMLSLVAPAWSSASDYAMQVEGSAKSMLLDIASAGTRLVAVGERGHILYSSDRGASWTQAKVPTSVMLTRVFFVSPEMGWAVGHDGNILVSLNGGVNWELQRDGVSDQANINEARAGRAKANLEDLSQQLKSASEETRSDLEEAVDEASYQLEDALARLDEPVFAPPLMDVWFSNEEQGWATGAYGTLLHTSNGGRHWDDWSHKVTNPDALHLNGVAGAPDGTLYLASEWGTVFRSLSGGEYWEPLESGYEGSFFGALVSPVTSTVFAYGLRGTVYRSSDRGDTWDELEAQARASLFGGLATENGTVLFVGQGGTAVRSLDDGNCFSALVQSSRQNLHGLASMGEGRFMATGDGGSVELVTTGTSSASQCSDTSNPTAEMQ